MREFFILIGELLLIALLQSVLEAVFDTEKRAQQLRVINIACIAISYLLLARYVFVHLLGEFTSIVTLPF